MGGEKMKLINYPSDKHTYWQLYAREEYFRELEGLPTRKQFRRMRRKAFIRMIVRFIPLFALMLSFDRTAEYYCTKSYFTPSGIIEIYSLKTTGDILKYEYFNNCKCDEQ
jgi:hypothetical protein